MSTNLALLERKMTSGPVRTKKKVTLRRLPEMKVARSIWQQWWNQWGTRFILTSPASLAICPIRANAPLVSWKFTRDHRKLFSHGFSHYRNNWDSKNVTGHASIIPLTCGTMRIIMKMALRRSSDIFVLEKIVYWKFLEEQMTFRSSWWVWSRWPVWKQQWEHKRRLCTDRCCLFAEQ